MQPPAKSSAAACDRFTLNTPASAKRWNIQDLCLIYSFKGKFPQSQGAFKSNAGKHQQERRRWHSHPSFWDLSRFTFLNVSKDKPPRPFKQHWISVWEDVFALPWNTGNREGRTKGYMNPREGKKGNTRIMANPPEIIQATINKDCSEMAEMLDRVPLRD